MSDVGIVYLIRVYVLLLCACAIALIAVLHCNYSFIIPFIYRIESVTSGNWNLRFQLVTTHLLSFPLWLDAWYNLFTASSLLSAVFPFRVTFLLLRRSKINAHGSPETDKFRQTSPPIPVCCIGTGPGAAAAIVFTELPPPGSPISS